jgi:hypothetical protein
MMAERAREGGFGGQPIERFLLHFIFELFA